MFGIPKRKFSVHDPDINMNLGNTCKFGCGQLCNPGRTARGNPFDTCCKSYGLIVLFIYITAEVFIEFGVAM